MSSHLGRIALMALAIAILPAAQAGAVSGAPSESPGATQHITYGGLEIDVPGDWTVVDLAAKPGTCVRFDVHTLYLGSPGAAQDCPAVVLGRTEAILLQPTPADVPAETVTITPGAIADPTPEQVLSGEIVARVSGTGLLMTAALGPQPASAIVALRSIITPALAPGLRADAAAPSTLAAVSNPPPLDRSFTWHHGYGFDACTAPSLSTMQAWLASPYRSIGIYIGGNSRGCTQTNLTASWVRSIATMGWKAQPLYVGVQAPCSPTLKSKMTPGQEWTQGRDSALDAITQARSLGIGPGSDLYYDMEGYPQSPDCSGSVRAFLSSWTETLRFNGYSSGVYSSAGSGIADLANGAAQPGFVAPDKIWIARWNGAPSIYGHTAYVADNQWALYQRIHQYLGGHNETFGVTINIDSDLLDTDPNQGSPFGQFESASPGPSRITARGWALDPDTSAPILVQMYIDGSANALASANEHRSDVASAYPASGPNHGYTVSMQTTSGPHNVCLYAINTGPGASRPLGCRVVTAGSSSPFGQIDTISAGPSTVTASGWTIDPDTAAPILVQMYIDGRTNALAQANQPRADVARIYPTAGPNHGYTVAMQTTPGPHNVCLYAINTGPGASTPLGCRNVTVASSNPFGQIDTVVTGTGTVTASGWTIDPDAAASTLVQMYIDGRTNALAWANRSRPDVARVYPSAGPLHGFTLTMPATAGTHSVCLYAINIGPGSSAPLGCRTAFVR